MLLQPLALILQNYFCRIIETLTHFQEVMVKEFINPDFITLSSLNHSFFYFWSSLGISEQGGDDYAGTSLL